MLQADTLGVLLETLRAAVPEIRGVVVASTDGLPIAHSLPRGTDPGEYAALLATLSDHGRRLGDGANSGEFSEAMIQGTSGQAFLFTARDKAIVGVFTELHCNTGRVRFESRKIASAVAQVL